MKLLPGKKPSDMAITGWLPAAIMGGSAVLGGLLSRGGGSGEIGAPGRYYDHLISQGEKQGQWGEELYNMTMYGHPGGLKAPEGVIEESGKQALSLKDLNRSVDVTPSYTDPHGNARYNREGKVTYTYTTPDGQEILSYTGGDQNLADWRAKGALAEYNEQYRPQFTTPDGKVFDDYDEAARYALDQGMFEAPVSHMNMEQAMIEANMGLIPKQADLAHDMIDAAKSLVAQGRDTEAAELLARTAQAEFSEAEAQMKQGLISTREALEKERAAAEMMELAATQQLIPEETATRFATLAAERAEAARVEAFAKAEQNLIPRREALEIEQIANELSLMPYRAERDKAVYGAETALAQQQKKTAPLAGETERQRLTEKQQIMEQRAPLLQDYFKQAGNVDPGARAREAQAEVAQQYGTAARQMEQNMTRTGARPGSGRMASLQGALQTDQARATAGAKTGARRKAEEDRFGRLNQAISLSGGLLS